jgi:UDP-glucose 4-epimerase
MTCNTILITGGAGFIGSHLVEQLVLEDNYIIIVDNLSTGKFANLSRIPKDKFDIEICDVTHKSNVEKVMKKYNPDIVYHLAATLGVKRTLERPALVMKTNVMGIYNILEASLSNNVTKIVNISSSSVYGNTPDNPMTEGGLLTPESPYSVSKLTAETMAETYMQEYGLRTTSLRPFNVYGPKQVSTAYGFVIPIFIRRLLEGLPPEIFGDGTQTRDFCYIDDCVSAIVMAGKSSAADGKVFNVCTGSDITIYKLAKTLCEMIGKNIDPKFLPYREDEIKFRCGNPEKINMVLGWMPRYTLEKGLMSTIDYFATAFQIEGDLTYHANFEH